ncbi:site-specific DNA-methyltransferase [Basfia succiniciproducens]|uniref:site-specific DNA-methyltransferase (adenine-specific) n=1 Tax=Basfia succiniciproducens TaxID=653940 RepID=A0A1G5BMB3_9PAST|nr:site-specific DNA-methyltransferase [Basfia succiniciproducens]QIM68401.1 type III restriction endonuclease subunit M [Basfia succiniciproducens]SCX91184.1 adenine-specific DNA-methyltransferase [Basfia succiniciproducens]
MITETLFNAENITANSPQLEQLKQLFPNCFDTSGRFLLEKFQAEIAQHTDISREFYSMNWLGKSYAKLLRNLPPETLLAEDVEHNSKEENAHSQNVLIQGDNLEVLKHLKNAYRNSVKMIYIDPPYNTGSDGFVYQDDRKFTPKQLATLANITQEEAERILNFTDKGSNSHSAWLTFMYPRLYVARELLKEDGVIFISIDDNEVAQLKLLCDEVFGEGNFVGLISVVNNPKGRSDQKNIATAHEYLLVYQNSNKVLLKGFKAEKHITKRYNKKDELGVWREIDLRKTGDNDRFEDRPNMYYPFYWDEKNQTLSLEKIDSSIEIYPMKDVEQKGRWRWGYENSKANLSKLFARYMPAKKQWSVFEKDYFDEGDFIKSTSVWDFKDVNSERGTEIFVKDLGFNKDIFPKPKPIGTIKRIIELATNSDDLILDFFAGSGTTAHAVMQLNAEDGGNRQFILVQLLEQTDPKSEAYKAGYKTIFEITKARIERAAISVGAGFIPARNTDNERTGINPVPTSTEQKIDLGFKIYQTTDNFNAVAEDEFHPNQAQLPHLTSLTESQIQTLLTTWRVYDGAKLTETVQAVDLGGYIAYLCDKRLYLLNEHFNSQHLLTFIQQLDNDTAFNPNRVIVFGNHMESAMQQELNQALASYSNRKNISLSLIVRA